MIIWSIFVKLGTRTGVINNVYKSFIFNVYKSQYKVLKSEIYTIRLLEQKKKLAQRNSGIRIKWDWQRLFKSWLLKFGNLGVERVDAFFLN
jgi:hypothetical protein